nr:MAG TPA: hypothetical protein [Caudoviricetes sp.]
MLSLIKPLSFRSAASVSDKPEIKEVFYEQKPEYRMPW